MSKVKSLSKSLKGISNSTGSTREEIVPYVVNSISNGSSPLDFVDITGGTINNVIIGNDGPGPINTTTIISGAPDGTGYDVIFYGDTVGEYASWNASLGLWTISGDLYTTGISDLGNIRISGNTISSTNANGDIILDPSGTGCLLINSCIEQNSTSGDVSFNVVNGVFDATSTGSTSLISTSGEFNISSKEEGYLTSTNGDITISTGSSKVTSIITNISTGTSPIVTTSLINNLEVGDSIKFIGTNSVPNLDGNYTVSSLIDNFRFRVTPGFNVTGSGNTGSFTKDTDIYLTASNNINIPYDVKLTFGSDTNYLIDTVSPLNEMSIVSGSDINITPGVNGDINIPSNVGITFGSDSRKIESDGTNLTISGSTLQIDSTNVVFTDPILKLDRDVPISNNLKDKGIEFNYYDTTSKLGWFGYDNSADTFSFYKNATNTGEVISGTLGNATFATGNFTNLNITSGSVTTPQIDTCNLFCNGLMTITGNLGIRLNAPSGQSVTIPQGTFLKFGDVGSPVTSIYKEASGTDLVIQSQSHIFLTPGSSASDVILPNLSGLVLNGENGSQYIKSISSTEMEIKSSSFLNLKQVSGGVRLTEGLPLIFNQNETTKILGDGAGNMLVNAENSINLIPSGGQVSIPLGKHLQLGSSTSYIGSSTLNNVVLSTPGTFSSTTAGNTNITSSSGDINLSPSGSVIIPVNKPLQLGNATQNIRSDPSGNMLYTSSGSQSITSTGSSINLSPSTSVNIPYSKPLQFGSSSENITGTAGNLTLTSNLTTTSGNLTVNGAVTTINSSTVTIDDPIITIGGSTNISDNNKDRGVEFNYFNGTSKLGYFGMDDTDQTFMYVPDAVNTSEVISGALGNVKFAGGSFTSLNLNNGSISSVNSIASNNNLTIQPGSGNDLNFSLSSGSNINIPVNVDLLFGGETNKIYSDGTDLHIVDSLVVDGGTTINGDLTVTGSINIAGGQTTNFTVQRFSVIGGGAQNPNSSSNITFITVSSSGVATGTIPIATIDGFIKQICISSLINGGTYELLFPTGRLLDPGTGGLAAKKLIFDMPGQAVQLVWDNVLSAYIMTSGGCQVILA
jgi:hypothetical protein